MHLASSTPQRDFVAIEVADMHACFLWSQVYYDVCVLIPKKIMKLCQAMLAKRKKKMGWNELKKGGNHIYI